ncbi:hypothetical protein CHS0354_002538 [Potamilus streckersoni]|uniref:Anion exchange protein n=1 Tax=Potamilus streckersoni TaxID=2493646 RepID=A0AAE0VQT6_9BIVA|nr:hypothetical protein CHS0354_002538 [Potamilus streckersoni]
MDGEESGPPIRDLGSFAWSSVPSDADIKEHRSADTVYIGLRLPQKRRHRHRHHRTRGRKYGEDPTHESFNTPDSATPAQRVQCLLGKDEDEDEEHRAHDLFCEMVELDTKGEVNLWKETARWIKFEEDVEEGGGRWSKPHVATLSLHSLFELRSCIMNGTVMLDMDAEELSQVVDLTLDNMVANKQLEDDLKERVSSMMLLRHQHQNEPHHRHNHDSSSKLHLPLIRSLADIGKKYSEPRIHHHGHHSDKDNMTGVFTTPNLQGIPERFQSGIMQSSSSTDLQENASAHKQNIHFMKKIPPGAEAANILVGEVDFLNHQIVGFVRLSKATMLGDLTEVPIPTRFIFLLVGPKGNDRKYHEIGRSIATLMSDEVFHDVAYHARNKDDLLAGIDEFLDQGTVLPPGEWDPSIRIEPPKSIPSQEARKTGDSQPPQPNGKAVTIEISHGEDSSLHRTGRLFGGLIRDIRNRFPWYLSDFRDALHIQCFASFVFLYFACLTPVLTFGGLLSDATGTDMAAIESLLSGAIVGVVYALFAGQPMTILGSTGPVLVFETILHNFCKDNGLNYLELRWWIGLWVGVMQILIVAFDLSALVRYITRFTEESFAALISLIFIKEAFFKVAEVGKLAPVNTDPSVSVHYDCRCVPRYRNDTNVTSNYTILMLPNDTTSETVTPVHSPLSWHHVSRGDCPKFGGVLEGPGCNHVADVFFLSVLLFIGTFTISYALKAFRNSNFLPARVRVIISDFAVFIGILSMVATDAFIGLGTPKLEVPDSLVPTNPKRGWIVNPVNENPWWLAIAAIIPAILASILIFMDQQITAVIVNRKENKLKKGHGYHLDLLIVGILIIINSCLGLPWFVAATVLSITHVNSLKKESQCNAPGERPKMIGAREQRVTGVAISLMIGLSIFLAKVLKYIPMPVLYGVFLYMGVSSLKGMQLVNRILIIFMPTKYQPDYMYLRHVPTRRVHLFTLIQVLCLAILWVIKTIKVISITFPIMVLAMCFVRKGMDYIFTQRELQWLDDIMPESHKREKEDEEIKKKDEESKTLIDTGGDIEASMDTRNINIPVERMTISTDLNSAMNITEEMSKTAIWKTIQANDSSSNLANMDERENGARKRYKKRDGSVKLYSKKNPNDDPLPPIPSSPIKTECEEFHKIRSKSPSKKKGIPVSFYIDEEEKEHLMMTPDIRVDPPSDSETKDESRC